MATTFDTWLAACAAAGKGGARWIWTATRALTFTAVLDLEGDWTGAVMDAYVRRQPDAAGAKLVDFTVTGPVVTTVDDVVTSAFTFTLASGSGANSTGALDADDDGDGVVDLPLFVTLTPSGGNAELFAGGIMRVIGD